METYIKASEILNNIAKALNISDHIQVQRLLTEFDGTLNGHKLPLDYIYRRIWAEAELSARIGNYIRGINSITSKLSLFEDDNEMRFNLLLKAGKLECLSSRTGVSSNFLIDALGLAEEIGNKHLIANAYEALCQMFSLRYPGLAIYFLRKAELLFAEIKLTKHLKLCQMERALLYSAIVRTRNISDNKKNRLVSEAKNIVKQYQEEGLNPHEIKHFRYIKAFVNCDEQELLVLMKDLEGIQALPNKCLYEDVYIGFCIEKGLWEEAYLMFNQYKQDIIALHGDTDGIQSHLSHLLGIIEQKKTVIFVPYHTIRRKDDPILLFDILDHYSLEDEVWALDRSPVRLMFPSYAQEGKFEAVCMPDGTTRLYPMGLAFNVYYRGQSEHYEHSYPTLYRKGMTPAKRFVERLKLEELRNCVEDYPITKLFKDGLYITFIDGSVEQIELAVDVVALAQHYGICTELMDLTTDKFVAAFFATTKYADGKYLPILDKQEKSGVFYRYSEGIPNYKTLSAVGLQPFSRPGEQCGLVYKMEENQNFNDIIISSDFFEHTPEVSQFIFNYTNRSKKLFPLDPLTQHAEQIVKSKVFSPDAYQKAKENFYKDTPDYILNLYLEEEKIEISDDVNFGFSKEEETACIEAWNNGGRERTLSQILVRPIYTGPIVQVDKK